MHAHAHASSASSSLLVIKQIQLAVLMWDVHDRAAVPSCQRLDEAGPKLASRQSCRLRRSSFGIFTPLSVKECALQLRHLDSKTVHCEISISGSLRLFKYITLNEKKKSLFSPNWIIGFPHSTLVCLSLFSLFVVSLNCGEINAACFKLKYNLMLSTDFPPVSKP